MNKKTSVKRALQAVLVMVGVAFMGCQDLDTVNINQPDEKRALSEPGDVESLISGSILNWWQIHNQYGAEHLHVTADAMTCSWGNYSMQDMSSEPRIAFPNNTSYRYIRAVEDNWYDLYKAISSVNDGLRAIQKAEDAGEEFLGDDTPRARAFAKLVQGLSHGYLACFYDRAFIFDETIDINVDVLELKSYSEVMDAAVEQLEAAITIAEANKFTLPEDWVNGLALTNEDLVAIAHSYIARYLAQVSRSPAERQAVDWAKVKSHAEKGVSEAFAPHGDGSFGGWFHSVQWFHNDRGASWARLDYKMIGGADKSNGYQNWLATPAEDRQEFDMETDDKRLTGMTMTNASGDTVDGGIYAGNWGKSPFRANRGTYHFSKYGYYRYESFAASGNIDPMPIFLPEENDFLIAEALLWTGGSASEIAAILDKTRVENGGYPPAADVTSGIGSVTDARSPLDGSSLWAMLKYEKQLELLQTGAGIEYFDNRGWGDLVTDTPVEWPIPAKELEVLQKEIYTFGGGGEGSAPKIYYGPPAGPE